MRLHTNILYILGGLLFIGSTVYAMQDAFPQDPLARINYRDAFNQSKIHKKYKYLMQQLGCDVNVFSSRTLLKLDTHVHGPLDTKRFDSEIPHLEKNYKKECLKQLNAARHWTIGEPARESITLLALTAGAALLTTKTLKKESFGGSISVFAALFNSIYLLRDTIHSAYNRVFLPAHPLNKLEDLFARNQCFIPKALWPVIIDKFMLARQNQFEQRKSMDFIEFALGLTMYKPLPSVRVNVHHIIQELHERIDQFFNDYDDMSRGEFCRLLKVNVSKFVLALTGRHNQVPRYVYFHGPGGIGKTYFVNQLSDWIQELIPDSVRFENLVVTCAEELEGGTTRPGVMLRVLRNQLMSNKRGSVVFMDEATWFNKEDMISSAKRVFNGNQSKLSTTYFGDGIDGTGMNLRMPPMLIFVASNEEIKDPNLKSRFDTIKYPLPKPKALTNYALELLSKSQILEAVHAMPTAEEIALWLHESNINDFRQVAANIEQFVLSKTYYFYLIGDCAK